MGNTNSYTKEEIDNKFENLKKTPVNFYTKAEIDKKIPVDFYTKAEIDRKIPVDFYTKAEVDRKIPVNFYTKAEIDQKIPVDFYTRSDIKNGTMWCANGDCITPSNNKKLKWGEHVLRMDSDKVIRHVNLQDNHSGMGFATENMYATKSLKIGEGKNACLYLGSHEICSDGGNLLRIKKSGENKYFDIYSDQRHSSFRTFNTNNDGSERESWQGYA